MSEPQALRPTTLIFCCELCPPPPRRSFNTRSFLSSASCVKTGRIQSTHRPTMMDAMQTMMGFGTDLSRFSRRPTASSNLHTVFNLSRRLLRSALFRTSRLATVLVAATPLLLLVFVPSPRPATASPPLIRTIRIRHSLIPSPCAPHLRASTVAKRSSSTTCHSSTTASHKRDPVHGQRMDLLPPQIMRVRAQLRATAARPTRHLNRHTDVERRTRAQQTEDRPAPFRPAVHPQLRHLCAGRPWELVAAVA